MVQTEEAQSLREFKSRQHHVVFFLMQSGETIFKIYPQCINFKFSFRILSLMMTMDCSKFRAEDNLMTLKTNTAETGWNSVLSSFNKNSDCSIQGSVLLMIQTLPKQNCFIYTDRPSVQYYINYPSYQITWSWLNFCITVYCFVCMRRYAHCCTDIAGKNKIVSHNNLQLKKMLTCAIQDM